MKKILCVAVAVVTCAVLACPVLANEFVPSISEKPAPEVEAATGGEQELTPCIAVTTIPEAQEKTTDIHQEARDELLEVYEELVSGTMELPIEGDYVIRELVDVSFLETDCIVAGDKHDEWLAEEDTFVSLVFDLQVAPETEMVVMVYIDGEWVSIPATNNGDGTLTCVFYEFCPVAFCVMVEDTEVPVTPSDPPVDPSAPPATGDTVGESLTLWITLMAISFVGILLLVIFRCKREE